VQAELFDRGIGGKRFASGVVGSFLLH
jgi:hypothetical protein